MSDDFPQDELEQALYQLDGLIERRRTHAARDILSRVLPQHPDNISLLEHAAWLSWLEDKDDEARAHAHRILELEPHNYSARVLLTRLHVASEAYVEAEQTVLGLLADYPESPELFALYADIMLQTFHIDKAEKLAAEALRFDPDNLSAMSIHAQCAFIRQPDAEQTARMQRLLKEHPDQAQTTILLVQRLLDNGKTSEAYRLSRSLVMSQPDNPHYVELANNLRFTNHWTMKPLWPVIKWGWGGSIAIWLVFMLYMKSGVLAEYQGTVALVFLGFVIYSWVWPWLLKRIMGIQ